MFKGHTLLLIIPPSKQSQILIDHLLQRKQLRYWNINIWLLELRCHLFYNSKWYAVECEAQYTWWCHSKKPDFYGT